MDVTLLSRGPRTGALRRGKRREVDLATALDLMSRERGAVVVRAAPDDADDAQTPSAAEPPPAWHLFFDRAAVLDVESPSSRSRLRRFEAGTEQGFEGDDLPLAHTLVKLGCAVRALPPPGPRHSLVQLTRDTVVDGVPLAPGSVAAVDFDPDSVLPELRGLGLFPWEVVEIEDQGPRPCVGDALDRVRLVVHLDGPWRPPEADPFLAGMRVDMAFRDYRRTLPGGCVERVHQSWIEDPRPRAVLGR
ncbi:MAG: hypothetical protein AAGD06_21360 [Acidobacteriota bacterium]